jgi:hypothetical protein
VRLRRGVRAGVSRPISKARFFPLDAVGGGGASISSSSNSSLREGRIKSPSSPSSNSARDPDNLGFAPRFLEGVANTEVLGTISSSSLSGVMRDTLRFAADFFTALRADVFLGVLEIMTLEDCDWVASSMSVSASSSATLSAMASAGMFSASRRRLDRVANSRRGLIDAGLRPPSSSCAARSSLSGRLSNFLKILFPRLLWSCQYFAPT